MKNLQTNPFEVDSGNKDLEDQYLKEPTLITPKVKKMVNESHHKMRTQGKGQ